MGTCSKCGKSGFLMTTYTCEDCKKQFCNGCFHRTNGISLCKDCLQNRRMSYYKMMTEQWAGKCPLCGASGSLYMPELSIHRHFQIVENYRKYYGPIVYDSKLLCNSCHNQITHDTLEILNDAIRAERAGRYEDAAIAYERLDFLDRARALRERDKTSTVRQVQVNLNHLLEQMRQGSLVIPYRCPHCGAGIKISGDMNAERLSQCPYCSGTMAIADIEKFLASIL